LKNKLSLFYSQILLVLSKVHKK